VGDQQKYIRQRLGCLHIKSRGLWKKFVKLLILLVFFHHDSYLGVLVVTKTHTITSAVIPYYVLFVSYFQPITLNFNNPTGQSAIMGWICCRDTGSAEHKPLPASPYCCRPLYMNTHQSTTCRDPYQRNYERGQTDDDCPHCQPRTVKLFGSICKSEFTLYFK
jgi:hypothetical protein